MDETNEFPTTQPLLVIVSGEGRFEDMEGPLMETRAILTVPYGEQDAEIRFSHAKKISGPVLRSYCGLLVELRDHIAEKLDLNSEEAAKFTAQLISLYAKCIELEVSESGIRALLIGDFIEEAVGDTRCIELISAEGRVPEVREWEGSDKLLDQLIPLLRLGDIPSGG